MSQYYNPKRGRNIFDPESKQPFRISRSKIDLFIECPRCFYLDRRLGVGRPPGFPFSLNSAVDTLLKKEFDIHRAEKTKHPLMHSYGVDAVPFDDPRMDEWRDALRRGITYHHKPTNLLVTGGVDDVWVGPKKELIIVDYKATAKDGEVSLDAPWQDGYKRQMEVYQWLLRQNGFKVSDTAYFVYANGRLDMDGFFDKVEFRTKIIPYKGSDKWIEPTLTKMKKCLEGDMPAVGTAAMGGECDYCMYAKQRTELTLKSLQANKSA